MAKLQSENLTLEIEFTKLEEEWIAYEISFLWRNGPIINDSIMKKNRWMSKRRYGTFLVNDYEKDSLIETIKKSVETGISGFWEPVEPDVRVTISQNVYFPFLTNPILSKKYRDDTFTIVVLIDTYNFEGCDAYSSDGISLNMTIRKKDLEKFVVDLEEEYDKLMMGLIKTVRNV